MVGIFRHKSKKSEDEKVPVLKNDLAEQPQLARRKMNRNSTIRSGRTIGERREKLETANERMIARKKDKRKKNFRIFFVSLFFIILIILFVIVYLEFFHKDSYQNFAKTETDNDKIYTATIEIIDESTGDSSKITNRMKEYIGQAEYDFRELGYHPVKAVIPSNAIREVDFYLENHPGFIKIIIDRDSAVSVEDADRMLRYLEGQGITELQYIDVRIPGKAFWK